MVKDLYISAVGGGGGGVPMLPSGTYTPTNSGVGSFVFLWEGQTGNVVTDFGEVEKTSGSGAWDGSAFARVNHCGDFRLLFKISQTTETPLARFGISYWKRSNLTTNLDFAFYRGGANASVVEMGTDVVTGIATSGDDAQYEIERIGTDIIYKLDDVVIHTTNNVSVGNFNIDCSIFNLGIAKEIQLIIP